MNLTVEDLKKVIEAAIKEFAEAGKKGAGGYEQDEDCPVQPRGFASSEGLDFTQESQEGNRYKKQGSSNMGPYTSENAIRAIAKDVLREALKPVPSKKMDVSAPFNSAQAKIGEQGSVGNINMPDWKSTKKNKKNKSDKSWFDTDDMKKNKKMKGVESNILQGVYESRLERKK